jgi:Uma2 family endonuclease
MATIATTPPTVPPGPLASPEVYRFTVDEYERMVLDDERVELIDGLVVRKMGKNPPHVWTTQAVRQSVERLLPPGWTWRQEQPVRIPKFDEPEPDIALVRGSDDDYKHRHPGPADVGLLVEVSETTLDRDQVWKLSVYAKARIPIYWIVNLVERQVEVYTNPARGRFRTHRAFTAGQQVPLIIGGVECGAIAVEDILP